jgi:hypothetical protein
MLRSAIASIVFAGMMCLSFEASADRMGSACPSDVKNWHNDNPTATYTFLCHAYVSYILGDPFVGDCSTNAACLACYDACTQ